MTLDQDIHPSAGSSKKIITLDKWVKKRPAVIALERGINQ